MIISLVQTSQNRRKELKRFVDSLNAQKNVSYNQIQLIFVDQENNRDIFDSLNKDIEFTYIQSNHCSLSHARNLAIPFVKGKYIAFPDDDCWYEPDTLYKAIMSMTQNKWDGVTGKGLNERDIPTGKFLDHIERQIITKMVYAPSYVLFFKFNDKVLFDENIGIGSPFNLGAGEETDYLLNLIERYNYKVFFEPSLIIHHPILHESKNNKDLLKKAHSYARGDGYLLQKHNFPFSYRIKLFLRPLGGIFIHALMLKSFNTRKSFCLLRGRIEGSLYKLKIDINQLGGGNLD